MWTVSYFCRPTLPFLPSKIGKLLGRWWLFLMRNLQDLSSDPAKIMLYGWIICYISNQEMLVYGNKIKGAIIAKLWEKNVTLEALTLLCGIFTLVLRLIFFFQVFVPAYTNFSLQCFKAVCSEVKPSAQPPPRSVTNTQVLTPTQIHHPPLCHTTTTPN